MSRAVDRLPSHLKSFIDQQDYAKYTPRDHAVWRYILKQNVNYFGKHGFAVSEYANGLNLTGISLDGIPKITDMDILLDKFGWGAVPVCGFIPPVAFLEFQSYGVLPIAHNMRSVDHIGYTPAPDIVHESAGHAPILVNDIFAEYLKKYALIAGKAISSKKYIQQYEAIRKLSDLKELPGIPSIEIEKAENELYQLSGEFDDVSESSQVVRLYWWTAEYGLFGDMDSPKVFGAGLLSSVDESQNCLKKEVKKIPFSIEAINYSYDITKPQPQLFVVRKFEELIDTLDEMEKLLSFRIGGEYGIKKGIASETVVTLQWDNNAFISGIIKSYVNLSSNLQYITVESPCQVAYENKIIEDNISFLNKEIILPVGLPQKMYGNGILKSLNQIKQGENVVCEFIQGFSIEGRLAKIFSNKASIGMLGLENAKVHLNGKIKLFEKYYLPIGLKIVSVCGGPFFQDTFTNYEIGKASTKPIVDTNYTDRELALFETYDKVHALEKNMKPGEFKRLCSFVDLIFTQYDKEWLLWLEVLSMFKNNLKGNFEISSMIQELNQKMEEAGNNLTSTEKELLKKGLRVLNDQ